MTAPENAPSHREPAAPAKKLRATVHFRRGDEALHLALKITPPLSWEHRTCLEALIEHFVAEYDRRHPEHPASAAGPFECIRVQLWSGPAASTADHFPPDRPAALAVKVDASRRPTYCLLSASATVAELRARATAGAVDVEIVSADATALASTSIPSADLVAVGERLIGMLDDAQSEPAHMHALVEAATARGPLHYAGVAAARDGRGRTALHVAVTRGDLHLCRKLMCREEDVIAIDDRRDSALTIAALAGRSLIVRELLGAGALVHEKNADLMCALNLACVDEAQGNGDVVRMLVEAGAEVDGKCWDVTPLMAAASAGHYWATQTLLELGADARAQNGQMLMALDYARDVETAELLWAYMKGEMLPDEGMVERIREGRRRRGQPDSTHAEPRLFQSVKQARASPRPPAPRLARHAPNAPPPTAQCAHGHVDNNDRPASDGSRGRPSPPGAARRVARALPRARCTLRADAQGVARGGARVPPRQATEGRARVGGSFG